jgi:hypothetical protein
LEIIAYVDSRYVSKSNMKLVMVYATGLMES